MKRYTMLSIAVIMLVTTLCSCTGSSGLRIGPPAYQSDQPKAWSSPGGDASRCGYFDWQGPASAGLDWKIQLNRPLTPLKQTEDGTLYAYSGGYSSQLVALDLSGRVSWIYDFADHAHGDGFIPSSFSIAEDGLIRFGEPPYGIKSLNPDGSVHSSLTSPEKFGQCRFDDQGRAYLGYENSEENTFTITALDHDGTQRWSIESTPDLLTLGDGSENYRIQSDKLYYLDGEYNLIVHDLDGSELWRIDRTTYMPPGSGNPSLAAYLTDAGHCYLSYPGGGGAASHLNLYSPAGELLWEQEFRNIIGQRYFNDGFCFSNNDLLLYGPDGNRRFGVDGTSEDLLVDGWVAGVSDTDTAFIAKHNGTSLDLTLIDSAGETREYTGLPGINTNELFIGYDRTIVIEPEDDLLEAYELTGTHELLWSLEEAELVVGIAVDTDGSTALVGRQGISFYAAGGVFKNRITYAPGTFESTPWFLGWWPEARLYIFRVSNEVITVDSAGNQAWRFDCGTNTPYIGLPHADRLYISYGPHISALNSTGGLVYDFLNPEPREFFDIAVDAAGTVYATYDDSNLIAITPAGEIKWSVQLDADYSLYVTCVSSEQILLSSYSDLIGLSTVGDTLWHMISNTGFPARPAVGPGGYIYQPRNLWKPDDSQGPIPAAVSMVADTQSAQRDVSRSELCELLVIDIAGRIQQRVIGIGAIEDQPLIDVQGNAYVVSTAGKFTSVSRTGNIEWQVDLRDYFDSFWRPHYVAPSPSGSVVIAHDDQIFAIGN